MSKAYIADREVHSIAELSRNESARFKRRSAPWHAPWPAQPQRKCVVNAEAEADDTLILRATIAAALRKNDNAP
jgi:hypothetical protein